MPLRLSPLYFTFQIDFAERRFRQPRLIAPFASDADGVYIACRLIFRHWLTMPHFYAAFH